MLKLTITECAIVLMGCISMIVDVFRSLRQSLQYVWHLLLLIHIQICQKTHKLHAVLLGHVGSELKLMHPTDWGGWGGAGVLVIY